MTTKASLIDLNGNEMILDADGDTTITADTDDQIDFKVGGTDRLSLKSDGKLSVTEINHISSGTLEIGNGDEKQLFDASGSTIQFQTNDTEAMRIDAAGIVTKPLQPYFHAYLSSDQTNFNSAGAFGEGVAYNAEVEDINSDFNTSTGLFTCPVDGTYWFIASVYSNFTFSQAWLAINTGSGAARATYTDFSVSGSANAVFTAIFYVHLDANDTVGYHPYTSSSTSATIYSNAYHTWFKGGLLY